MESWRKTILITTIIIITMTVRVESSAWAPWARRDYRLQCDVLGQICRTGEVPEKVDDERFIFSTPEVQILEPENGVIKVADGSVTVEAAYTQTRAETPLAIVSPYKPGRRGKNFTVRGDGTTGLFPTSTHLITVTTYTSGGEYDSGENPRQLGKKRFIIQSRYYRLHLKPHENRVRAQSF